MFDKWAKKFDALNVSANQLWYYSSTGELMTMNHFSKSFNNSIKSHPSHYGEFPPSSFLEVRWRRVHPGVDLAVAVGGSW